MFNSIMIVGGIAFAAAAEIVPELNDWMELVSFPEEVSSFKLVPDQTFVNDGC